MVFVELGIEALLCASVDSRKMAPSRFSRSGTNVRQAIRERHSTPRIRDPMSLHRSSSLTRYLTCTRLGVRSSRLNREPKASIFFMRQSKARCKALFLQAISQLRSFSTAYVPHFAFNRSSPELNSDSCVGSLSYLICYFRLTLCVRSPSYLIWCLSRPLPLHASHVTPINHQPWGRDPLPSPLEAGLLPARHVCLFVITVLVVKNIGKRQFWGNLFLFPG